MVGVHPYTPDALVDVIVDHDRVQIRLPDFFRRPLRLTPAQAFALLVAGRSLQSVPGADESGPLARGLAKLATTLGAESSPVVEVDLGEVGADDLALLQQAAAEGRSVEIDYYSYGRDAQEVRRVDPWRVQAAQGQWYLEAWCHRSQAERVFRVDRIRSVTVLDDTFERPAAARPLEVFRPTADDPRVVLDLAPGPPGWWASIPSRRSRSARTADSASPWRSQPSRGSNGCCCASVPMPSWSTLRPGWRRSAGRPPAASSSVTGARLTVPGTPCPHSTASDP